MRAFSKPIPVVATLLAVLCTLFAYERARTSTLQVFEALPTPVAPEPYPFSDRYPALIYLDSRADLDLLYRYGIDIDNVAKAGEGKPGALVVSVYVNAG